MLGKVTLYNMRDEPVMSLIGENYSPSYAMFFFTLAFQHSDHKGMFYFSFRFGANTEYRYVFSPFK